MKGVGNRCTYMGLLICLVSLFMPMDGRATQRDSLQHLSQIPGADLSLYHLYEELSPTRRTEAMKYAELFLQALDTTLANPTAAHLANNLAEFYEKEQFTYSDAIDWQRWALSQYKRLGDDFGTGHTLYSLARIYYRIREYHLTLESLDKALTLLAPYEKAPILSECYNLLGATHFMCQDYPNAKRYFEQYAATIMDRRDSTKIPVALNNLAVYAQSQKDTTRSRQLLETAIEVSIEKENKELLVLSYMNLISNLIESRNIHTAEKYLELTLPLIRNAEMMGKYHIHKSVIHQLREEWDQSIEHLLLAIEQYKLGEFDLDLHSSYSQLIEIYLHQGEQAKANEVAQAFYQLTKQRKLETSFQQLFKYQNEIIRQKEAERLSEKENNQKRMLFLGLSGLGLLFVIALIYYWKRSEIIRRKEMELQQERLINEKNQQAIRSKNEILEIRRMEEYKVDRMRADVIEQLNHLKPLIKEKEVRNQINQICNEIENSKGGDLWEEISAYIPEFNREFSQRLVQDFPTLSVNERRLCAFLNMNLSTKEISEITKQSPHSINIARGRLRKKLGLTGQDLSIQEFLTRYQQNNA